MLATVLQLSKYHSKYWYCTPFKFLYNSWQLIVLLEVFEIVPIGKYMKFSRNIFQNGCFFIRLISLNRSLLLDRFFSGHRILVVWPPRFFPILSSCSWEYCRDATASLNSGHDTKLPPTARKTEDCYRVRPALSKTFCHLALAVVCSKFHPFFLYGHCIIG